MDRGAIILQGLREKLTGSWASAIRRSVGATSVEFLAKAGGHFAIRVSWKNGDNEYFYEKEFTREHVLGATMRRPMAEWGLEKRACDHARDIIREILAQRGVL